MNTTPPLRLTSRGRSLVGAFLLTVTVLGFAALLVAAAHLGEQRRCDALAADANVALLEQYRCPR